MSQRILQRNGERSRRPYGLWALWAAALLCLGAALALWWFWKPVTVTFLDVGQGDSCLIQEGRRSAVLIDGGDLGEGTELREIFRLRNLSRLDAAFVSHFHQDHVSGIIELLEENFPIGVIYAPDVESGTLLEDRLLTLAEHQGIPVKRLRQGDALTLGTMEYETLWPGPERRNQSLNNSSLVLRVSYGSLRLLFTGDIEIFAAKKLVLQYGAGLRAEVLKAPHHGGVSSAQRDFFEACAPVWAVISAGEYNQYHNPAEETLEMLRDVGAEIWRTDRDGTVELTLGRRGLKRIDHSSKWR